MAGGIGSRFWPMSTPEYPKQFIDVMGCGKSLIQLIVECFLPLCPIQNFWVVTSEKYTAIVKKQLPELCGTCSRKEGGTGRTGRLHRSGKERTAAGVPPEEEQRIKEFAK